MGLPRWAGFGQRRRGMAVPLVALGTVPAMATSPTAPAAMAGALPTMDAGRMGGDDDGRDDRVDSVGDVRSWWSPLRVGLACSLPRRSGHSFGMIDPSCRRRSMGSRRSCRLEACEPRCSWARGRGVLHWQWGQTGRRRCYAAINPQWRWAPSIKQGKQATGGRGAWRRQALHSALLHRSDPERRRLNSAHRC